MKDIIIVGAGISGLTAATYFQKKSISFQIIESKAYPGGRIGTTEKEGYLLDHGFQVFLPMYPEAKAILDYTKLDLRNFLPGALLLLPDGIKSFFSDPLRNPSSFFQSLFSKGIPLSDKWKLFQLANKLKAKELDQIFASPEKPTIETWQEEYGFHQMTLQHFLHPFFAGIFLEKKMKTDRRMFDFIFKMFSEGLAAIPNKGMQMIPQQLADNIESKNIAYQEEVVAIEGGKVTSRSGKSWEGKKVLLATEAIGLVKDFYPSSKTDFQSTWHIHYLAKALPFEQKVIALNGNKNRLVNNLCVISNIAPGYAPGSKHLISLSIIGNPDLSSEDLDVKIRQELKFWFGDQVLEWELFDARFVKYALPNQQKVQHDLNPKTIQVDDHLYICGDHLLNGSVNAAMKSGRIAAEFLAQKIK